jgi:hypothetical protein
VQTNNASASVWASQTIWWNAAGVEFGAIEQPPSEDLKLTYQNRAGGKSLLLMQRILRQKGVLEFKVRVMCNSRH